MRVLIVGCGYSGVPLAAELVRQGHDVFGVRRTAGRNPELNAAGIRPVVGDITKSEDLKALPGPFDWVVNMVSSTQGGAKEYRQGYGNGTGNLLEWFADYPPQKIDYPGSYSVYRPIDGSEGQGACAY